MRVFRSKLVVLLVGGAFVLWAHRPLRAILYRVLRWPLTAAESLIGAAIWLPDLPAISRERTELRAALAAQQMELIRLRETVRRLARAAELQQAPRTGAGQAPGAIGPVASVIGRTIIPTQHVLLLNQGARGGVTLRSIWMDVDGVVGRTLDVQPATSRVLLLTDPDSRVAAVLERSRESGLLIGTGGSWCQLIYLDLDADVQPGDRVLTAGLGGGMPKGLPLGTVTRVVRRDGDATTVAWIKPAVHLSRLEDVVCLAPLSPSS